MCEAASREEGQRLALHWAGVADGSRQRRGGRALACLPRMPPRKRGADSSTPKAFASQMHIPHRQRLGELPLRHIAVDTELNETSHLAYPC